MYEYFLKKSIKRFNVIINKLCSVLLLQIACSLDYIKFIFTSFYHVIYAQYAENFKYMIGYRPLKIYFVIKYTYIHNLCTINILDCLKMKILDYK